MLPFQPKCLPLMLGPLPHNDAVAAWRIVLRTLPSLPVLPILGGGGETLTGISARGLSSHEAQHAQVIDRHALVRSLPMLDAAYLRGHVNRWAVELNALPWLREHEVALRRSRALCGCVVGPISLALQLVDAEGMPLIGDVTALSALSQHLFLRRRWLHDTLRSANDRVLVWLYEPFGDTLNDPFCPTSAEQLCIAVDQALGYDQPRAVWASHMDVLRSLSDTMRIDVIGLPLPMPEQAEAFAPLMRRMLSTRGGVGWGLVPIDVAALEQVTVGRLAAHFGDWLGALEAQGFAPDDVATASFIMPVDTLDDVDVETAERVLSLAAEVAAVVRHSYGVD